MAEYAWMLAVTVVAAATLLHYGLELKVWFLQALEAIKSGMS